MSKNRIFGSYVGRTGLCPAKIDIRSVICSQLRTAETDFGRGSRPVIGGQFDSFSVDRDWNFGSPELLLADQKDLFGRPKQFLVDGS